MSVKSSTAVSQTGPKSDRMVVVHFQDGSILKGTTYDFAPGKPTFHVYRNGEESTPAIDVALEGLKAVFYVKSYAGRKQRKDSYDFERAKGHGRKIAVRFHDGETICGWTMGYRPEGQGFFMIPAAAEGNNARIYVLNKAVDSVTWL